MKKMFLIIMVLTLAILACSIDFGDPTPGPVDPTATNEPGSVETSVAQTLTAQQPTDDPGGVETAVAQTLTAQQTQVATDTPQPSNTPTDPPPQCQPVLPGVHQFDLPVQAAISHYESESVDLVDFNGGLVHTFLAPGYSSSTGAMMHIGGGLGNGYPNLPLFFHTYANTGEIHRNLNGTVSLLSPASLFVTMAGLDGIDFFAYSNSGNGADGWTSDLFYGSSVTLPGSPSMLHRYEGDGKVIYPLDIHDAGAGPIGIFYTASLYGIGNIYFPPYSGYYYLEIGTNTVTEYLPDTISLLGFSPDHTMVAYSSNYGTGTEFYVKNLITCQITTINMLPGTNHGAGYVTFSTDNSRIAWVELAGPDLMSVTPTMRVSLADGTILTEGTAADYAGLNGGVVPTWIRPWAWRDDHVLVIGVNNDGMEQTLVFWAPDPAALLDPVLGANQSAPFANGIFLDFVYP